MASHDRLSKNGKSSIQYWRIPLDVPNCGSSTKFLQKSSPRANANGNPPSETKYPIQGISTAKFLSAVARVWEYVENPAVFHNDESIKVHQKENIICYTDQSTQRQSPAGSENLSNGLQSRRMSSSTRLHFEELKCIKRQLFLTACNKYVDTSLIWKRVLLSGFDRGIGNHNAAWSASSSVEDNPCESMYEKRRWEVSKDFTNDMFIGAGEKTPVEVTSGEIKENHVNVECYGSSYDESTNLVGKDLQIPGSLYSTHSLTAMRVKEETLVAFRDHTSTLHLGHNFKFLNSTSSPYGQCQQAMTDNSSSVTETSGEVSTFKASNIQENDNSLSHDLFLEQWYLSNYWLTAQDKVENLLMKNRHAIAGALAGTMVSLCLHPIDTLKTNIQADGISQKSVYHTLRKIVLEKGISGLYRGIATNIASSAPISAIYTFTYESVKGSLLPILPKEYHSLAHCFAGGCSSIATSVVFTPSERIKQQMQVGLQYQNCWKAFIGCLQKGGLPSLYSGWMAVLCRNIPHSIIKFYIYESLNQLFLTSAKPDSSLSTLQTLFCGGVAGSTAALFTTPFDVVKTKLQTQAPGTLRKYNGVFHTLEKIARGEGLRGLYRGLTPRLAIYISQGAIFFASYEFFKTVFALEDPKTPVQLNRKS